MSNSELISFWERSLLDVPCLVLFEDFDNIFHNRKNIVDSDNGVTFDCLLNCISGANQSEGIFIAITANDITKIDDALGGGINDDMSSRPGRIDEIIELGEMDRDCRIIMAQRILGEHNVGSVVNDTDGMTAAQFIEICTRTILSDKYDSNNVCEYQEVI